MANAMKTTRSITIKSYAKINLSIDVLGKLDNGYHEVEMVMQQVALHDDVCVKWMPGEPGGRRTGGGNETEISLGCNRPYLPRDERNLAFRAAQLMASQFAPGGGRIRIDIKKRIPVGAGLAGGSGNAAAVLLGLSWIWDLGLPLSELCRLGAKLGADVPFCIMGQARANPCLGKAAAADPMAAACALARGTGTVLTPAAALDCYVVLTKPPISVSTAEVYEGLDRYPIVRRPDTPALLAGLLEKNYDKIQKNMGNVLEIYTLKRYPIVMYTKNMVQQENGSFKVMMSGSGPTIFALFKNKEQAQAVYESMLTHHKETYLTRTIT